jgi:hypothetical protein
MDSVFWSIIPPGLGSSGRVFTQKRGVRCQRAEGRVAVAGWLLAGWKPVLLIDPGGDGKQEIRKYFLQEFVISVKTICTSD